MVRFDQPCRRVSGALEYFSEHMQKGDYLTQLGHALMTWHGQAATKLGLSGVVDLLHFERLCNGQNPFTGEKLGPRNKAVNRRVCYFGQISAPKDVSIAYLVGGDHRIKGWWEEAVKETITEIEAVTAARVRKGGANEDRVTGNMVAAVVNHDASRSLDPQLHTHLCIMNMTYDAGEHQWKGIQPDGYYRHQGYFREVCYNKLAQRMMGAGYELEKVRKIGFTIKGFPEELRNTFSKRRVEILKRAAQLGVTSQDGLHQITGQSRTGKVHIEANELKRHWESESGAHLDAVKQTIAQADGTPKPAMGLTSSDAMDSAQSHLFERHSVVDERVLLREALIAGRGFVELESLRQKMLERIKAGDLVSTRNQIGSRENLQMESGLCQWAARGKDQFSPFGLTSSPDPALSEEQQKAVEQVLGSRDRIVVLQGDAGTGKTTSLRSVVRGLEAAKQSVFACAPSSGATEVLRQELTPDADTLQQLLQNSALQNRIRGKVILVDEAGLVSVRQMYELGVLAQQNNNRLILVGDIKQHASVEAGDSLRALQKYGQVNVTRLAEIHRQHDPEYRKAVSLLAQGKAVQAFQQFEKLGAVKELDQPQKLFAEAAKDYVATLQAGKSCLAISPVWSEIHQFTGEVRNRLKESGLLGLTETTVTTVHSLQLTAAEKKDLRNYQLEDRITFHRDVENFRKLETVAVVGRTMNSLLVETESGQQFPFVPSPSNSFDVGLARPLPVALGEKLLIRANCKPAKIQNGEIVEVSSVDADGSIKLKDGRQLPAHFRQFTYGYASTSHAAQGKTVDHGILMMSEEGIAAGNLKQAYVSNSRFRESQTIYTHDKKAACEAMATPADRLLTLELNATHPDVQHLHAMADAWEAEQRQMLGAALTPSTGT